MYFLDLVLVSKDYCAKLIEVDCRHSPAIVELSAIIYQPQVTETKYVYNFKMANFSELNLYTCIKTNIDWAIALNIPDLEVMYSTFLRLFLEAIHY